MRQLILMSIALVGVALAQITNDYQGKQYGGSFALAETGASLSGYYRWPLWTNWTMGGIAEFHLLRDADQLDYRDPYTGIIRTFNKVNNLYYFSLYGEIKKRMASESLDNSLRPFWVVGGGAIYAMNYPEKFINHEGEVVDPDDEFSPGVQATVGLGIDISTGKSFTLSIRPQYRFIYFQDPVAGRQDHSAVEIRFEFGTTKPY